MSNQKLKDGGPGFMGDLARMGGDPAGDMTDDEVAASGPGFWPDMARMGGNVLGPSIVGTPVLEATENAAYDGFTVTGSGGTAPLVYALVGTWPTGIAINSGTGAVTGTPTQDGSFASLSVKVTDANSHVAQLPTFTLVVEADGG